MNQKLIFSVIVVLFLPTFVSASKYLAPTDNFTNSTFSASSFEIGDVISDGSDLGNTTVVNFATVDGFRLSFKIDNTKDLNLRDLKIKISPEKTVIDKVSSIDLYTLYVQNLNNGKGIFVCPQAKNLDELNKNCSGIKKFFEPFPQIILDPSPILVELNESYSVSGLSSGGVGLLSADDKPENKTSTISQQSIESLYPLNLENLTTDFTFRCKAKSDSGLKTIELYTNLNGSFQLTSSKQTTEIEDVLELPIKKPAEGSYLWFCRFVDNSNQEKQSDVYSFSVQEQKPTECVEEWICSPFQPLKCNVGSQTRTCTDKNNCGTTKNKLPEIRDCQSKCLENWFCSNWTQADCGTRKCSDSNQCDNQQYQVEKPSEFEDCSEPPIQTENNQIVIIFILIILAVIGVFFIYKRKQRIEE